MSAAHTPRPAIVPPAHADQRYYAESGPGSGVYAVPPYTDRPLARVFRYATDDTAELSISLGVSFEAAAQFTPADLRRIASDLLDAAHDIEQHPAATLCPQPAQEVAA